MVLYCCFVYVFYTVLLHKKAAFVNFTLLVQTVPLCVLNYMLNWSFCLSTGTRPSRSVTIRHMETYENTDACHC